MSELNCVELKLKEIYDEWDLGNELEKKPEYSAMFRMGFPDEFINNNKSLVMYVGQECRDCNSLKTQEWIRKFQTVQMKKEHVEGFTEGVLASPFWNFYRKIAEKGYNVLWNNLDKFHHIKELNKELKQELIKGDNAEKISAQYGEDNKSILQREIELIKPDIVLLIIGPKWKYIQSFCSAFGISDLSMMKKFKPTKSNPVSDLSEILAIPDTKVLWTYHPAYLNRINKYSDVLEMI